MSSQTFEEFMSRNAIKLEMKVALTTPPSASTLASNRVKKRTRPEANVNSMPANVTLQTPKLQMDHSQPAAVQLPQQPVVVQPPTQITMPQQTSRAASIPKVAAKPAVSGIRRFPCKCGQLQNVPGAKFCHHCCINRAGSCFRCNAVTFTLPVIEALFACDYIWRNPDKNHAVCKGKGSYFNSEHWRDVVSDSLAALSHTMYTSESVDTSHTDSIDASHAAQGSLFFYPGNPHSDLMKLHSDPSKWTFHGHEISRIFFMCGTCLESEIILPRKGRRSYREDDLVYVATLDSKLMARVDPNWQKDMQVLKGPEALRDDFNKLQHEFKSYEDYQKWRRIWDSKRLNQDWTIRPKVEARNDLLDIAGLLPFN